MNLLVTGFMVQLFLKKFKLFNTKFSIYSFSKEASIESGAKSLSQLSQAGLISKIIKTRFDSYNMFI